jgi:hypothetical protein
MTVFGMIQIVVKVWGLVDQVIYFRASPAGVFRYVDTRHWLMKAGIYGLMLGCFLLLGWMNLYVAPRLPRLPWARSR